jgi:hypothetical protein
LEVVHYRFFESEINSTATVGTRISGAIYLVDEGRYCITNSVEMQKSEEAMALARIIFTEAL